MHLLFIISFSIIFLATNPIYSCEEVYAPLNNHNITPISVPSPSLKRVVYSKDEEPKSLTTLKRTKTTHTLTLNGPELDQLIEDTSHTNAHHLILLGNVKKSANKLIWFKELAVLDISNANLSLKSFRANEGLDTISKLTTLTSLNCGSRHVNDEGLSLIANLHKLRTLIVANPSIFGKGLPALNTLMLLEELDISGTHVTADYLYQLSLPNLRRLKVCGSFISDTELELFKDQIAKQGAGLEFSRDVLDFRRI